uniref:Retrotransposon gag domain-containing protein n=1 Tax=Tanacetum cinerariifolium TaxID=118510 RepID=A0A6L2NT37_TANCI|nr:hypothetical protein [Tanacetum cinerariifolium]
MSTRSSARNLFPPLDNLELTIRRRPHVDPTLLNDFEMATNGNGDDVPPPGGSDLPVPDLRTMEEFIKVNGVTDDAFRPYLFPHSLKHHAIAWFDHFPRNSINTFVQMAKMFHGKYFLPSMVTKLRNEITNFYQRPDESLFDAWERYKLSIIRCGTFMKRRPEECYDLIENMTAHHNGWDTSVLRSESSSSITFSFDPEIVALKAEMAEINKNLMKILQINKQENQLLIAVKLVVVLILTMIVQPPLAKLRTYMLREPIIKVNYQNQNRNQGNNHGIPQGNNQGRNQFFQGASHGQNPPPAYQALGYQASVHQALIPQPQVVTTTEFINYMKANDAILKNMQTNITSLTNFNFELMNMFGQFMKMNTASSLGFGTLPCNTITNPKEDLKVERGTEVTKDMVPPTNNRSTKDIQPLVVQIETLIPNSEPIIAPVAEPVVAPVSSPNQKLSIPYPSRLHDQKLRDKANDQKEKIFKIFQDLDFNISFANALILMPKFGPTIKSLLTNKEKLFELARIPLNEHCSVVLLKKLPEKLGDPGELTLRVGKEAVTFNLDQTSRYSANYDAMSVNRIDLIGAACEEYSHEVLGFSCKLFSSGNSATQQWNSFALTVGKCTSMGITITSSGNALEHFIALTMGKCTSRGITITTSGNVLEHFIPNNSIYGTNPIDDEPISPEIDDCYYDSEGDILLLEEFLNDDPSSPPLPLQEVKVLEPTNEKSSINEPPVVELKDLPPHLEYAFLEGNDKLLVIIAKDLKDEEKTALIKVLKSHKQALAWVNLKIHEVIKNEVLKLLDARLIYPISDIPWVSPVHCVPKKGGFIVVENEENELIPTRLVTGWREKSHFMVKEGIVLSHKISKNGIEVDKVKVDVIVKLPHPTIVKGICSFLGHACFYRRFIQDFSKIARSMTRLLEKDTSLFFSKECIGAFQTLKKKLIDAQS